MSQAQPTHEPRIARVAAMVADPARSRMLSRLLSGEWATAGELAQTASVTPATASQHLAKLVDAAFVVAEPRGRHRYFRLASPEIAHLLEALALVAEPGDDERGWSQPGRQRLRAARCCYGHLAGRLGVALFDSMLHERRLSACAQGFELTAEGRSWLTAIGMNVPEPKPGRRFAYACLDWSERHDHLAGSLADAFLAHFVDRGWLRRGADRVVELTPRGQTDLLSQLGQAPALSQAARGPTHDIQPEAKRPQP
jgi:DNA-binding transcriptional ArsR family regulator